MLLDAETAAHEEPRLAPGTPEQIGRLNFLIARAIGLAAGGGPPNVFTTLARHRRLFRPWLRFAAALMPGGSLPRADSELVILRVAHNAGSRYEWQQHERLARAAGLSGDDVHRVRRGSEVPGWSPRQRVLLRATDELHSSRDISSALWDELRPLLGDKQLIELCMLVGHYEMLAMTLNALRVQPDELSPGTPRLSRRVQAMLARHGTRSRKT